MNKHVKGRTRKKVLIAMIITVSLITIIGALVAGAFALMKHDYGDRTEILEASSEMTKKALVVYQPSITSASSDVAHAIAAGLNDSGFEVKLSNPGKHLSADISAYSIIVFGMPNYGGSVVEPLSDYIQSIDDFSDKRIILFSTSGGISNMLEIEKLAALLGGAEPYKAVKYKSSEGEKNISAAYQLGVEAAGP
jgi:flavorubredoxin